MDLGEYVRRVEAELRAGNATEHTYRAALQELIESLEPHVRATNEPKRTHVGAPDYVVSRDGATAVPLPIGFVEAKDVGIDLAREERSEQLTRYRSSLSNLVLTDYLSFRWYLDGELRATASLGAADSRGRVVRAKGGAEAVLELLRGFLAQAPPQLRNPRELAERMARLTHMLREHVLRVLSGEGEEGTLHAQLQAFRRTLVPDLEAEDFADMYAQTVAYGLFAARAATPFAPSFSRLSAPHLLPRTNPFLRRFFNEIAGPDLDDRVAWLVDALAALLGAADMGEILKDFGRRTRREDPVVHFYETFLARYDPRTRERRGVYYTPEPVVSYMVRSVDALIKSRLGRPRGLGDEHTIVLDPALGTGTFLYGVINHVYEGFAARNNLGAWPGYVGEKLLKRVFGFELLMAPYAVAHLKLGLLLQQTGYEAQGSDERLGIYLTNTLAEGVAAPPIAFAEYISQEANAAAEVKRDKPIEVVIGNPPYSGHSANKGEWIGSLVRDYYRVDGQPLGERNPKWLQDDYVKFIRFGQWRIDQTGQGILAFISNNGYLDNPTFRGMRQSLMSTFSSIYILDLHGNSRKRERTPEGGPDENVFDIQQGVAIALFVKEPGVSGPAKVYHADLWGEREGKYNALRESDVETIEWTQLAPKSPSYLFTPQDADLRAEYNQGWKVTEIMAVNVLGFQTHRDQFAIDIDEEALRNRISQFRNTSSSDDEVRQKHRLGNWDVGTRRSKLRNDDAWKRDFIHCLYRPFDVRYCYYNPIIVDRPRRELLDHVVGRDNLCLNTVRQTKMESWQHAVVSDTPTPALYVEVKDGSNVFPLYLYREPGQRYHRSDAIESARKAIRAREGLDAREMYAKLDEVAELVRRLYPEEEYDRWPNLAPAFLAEIEERLGLRYAPEAGAGRVVPMGGDGVFGPEDVFHYMYAVLHSPTYRSRYAPFLKSDFPRVPLTGDVELFRDLTDLGRRLVELHLLRAPELAEPESSFPQAGTNLVEAVRYDAEGRRVFINKAQHFTHVPPEVWEFHVGGYQVAEKWLKDRKGRKLSYDDIAHYERVVTALGRTITLMDKIDARIPGWPLA
jgi:hypothetical protein